MGLFCTYMYTSFNWYINQVFGKQSTLVRDMYSLGVLKVQSRKFPVVSMTVLDSNNYSLVFIFFCVTVKKFSSQKHQAFDTLGLVSKMSFFLNIIFLVLSLKDGFERPYRYPGYCSILKPQEYSPNRLQVLQYQQRFMSNIRSFLVFTFNYPIEIFF